MRVAHISDLHLRHHLPGTASISARLSRAMPERFAAALNQIRSVNPDLLVVSGDLIDYPLDALNDPVTQELGRKDLELIAALLAELPFPIALVHGNHDHPALIDQVFGHIPNDQIVKGYRILTFRDDEGINHVPVRVGKEQARFLSALDNTNSLPQIHIQHYIVWPERNEEYPHTYGAGAQMRDAIIASGKVRLVLSGHYHTGVPLFQDKGVWFATVRGFTEAPHPFNVYEIADANADDGADTIVTARTFTLAPP
jgi:3',5'-cyclic AMP phosphodiesterase CpdA